MRSVAPARCQHDRNGSETAAARCSGWIDPILRAMVQRARAASKPSSSTESTRPAARGAVRRGSPRSAILTAQSLAPLALRRRLQASERCRGRPLRRTLRTRSRSRLESATHSNSRCANATVFAREVTRPSARRLGCCVGVTARRVVLVVRDEDLLCPGAPHDGRRGTRHVACVSGPVPGVPHSPRRRWS